MKNKLMTIGIAVILILTSVVTVYAADETETTVTLSVDKNQAKVGETITVTLKATCPDGINGVVTTYSYDESKLEYVSENVVDTNYSFIGNKDAKEIAVISMATDLIQSADVYAITFKVKEGVEVNSVATISVSETLLDSDAATDSEHTIAAQEVNVTIVGDTEEQPPVDDGNDDGETPPADDGNDDGETPPADYGNDDVETPPADDGNDDEKTPSTDDKKEEDKDTTVADKEYDKAGTSTIISLAAAIVAIVANVMYAKNKKYQDII